MAASCSIAAPGLSIPARGDRLLEAKPTTRDCGLVAAARAVPLQTSPHSLSALPHYVATRGRSASQVCETTPSSRSGYFGSNLKTPTHKPESWQNVSSKGAITMRLKGEYSFTVKGDLDKVYEYASDFSHIDAWDPGTPNSEKDSSLTRDKQEPVGVGTQFNLRTILLGYVTPTVYEILEYKPPRFLKIYGVSDFHDSYDSLWFDRVEQDPSLVRVTYVSEIQLTGWYRYFQTIMSWLLLRLFKDAVKGLERKLHEQSMQPELQPAARGK